MRFRWVLLIACAVALGACAGGAETFRVDGGGGGGKDKGIVFGDGQPRLDTSPPIFDGPRLDGPVTSPDGATPDATSPDAPAGVYDEDGGGHCAPGQSGPTCKSFNDCDDKNPARHPDAIETCANRGVDNDCDGDSSEVDTDSNGVDDIGEICQTALPGICASGKRACSGGGSQVLICQPDVAVGSRPETCNGLDDDCNGTVDNGNLCASGETCAGTSGCRCGSGPACTGGKTCNGGSCTSPCSGSNVALTANATSSGGGTTAVGSGPDEMNDGVGQASCNASNRFHWLDAPNGSGTASHWIQLTWSAPVTVGRVVIDTNSISNASLCGYNVSTGRSLAGGTLQYRQGSSWITITTISGQTDDWSRTFTPVSTTAIRIVNAHAYATGNKNPLIVEWQAFCQ